MNADKKQGLFLHTVLYPIFFLLPFFTAILSRQLKQDRFPRPPTFGPDLGTEDPPLNSL
jgi:hypothetical protein